MADELEFVDTSVHAYAAHTQLLRRLDRPRRTGMGPFSCGRRTGRQVGGSAL